jgi:hypothetical protein
MRATRRVLLPTTVSMLRFVDVARAHLHDKNMTAAQRAWLRDFRSTLGT